MLYREITSGRYIVAAHPPSPFHVVEGLRGVHGPRTAKVRWGIITACLIALVLPGLLPAEPPSKGTCHGGNSTDDATGSTGDATSGMGLILAQVCDDVPLSVEGAFADAVTGLVTVRARGASTWLVLQSDKTYSALLSPRAFR